VIRFGLLGPVTAWRDGREVELGSPQQRMLFALLLLHRNEAVSTDRMIDVLWPAAPPANALQVVRTYVSRLRALGTTELITHRQGYEVRAGPGEVDADRFESLVAAGRDELEGGDAIAAEALLVEALALVRGPPLPELPDDHAARAERGRLAELEAGAEEELVEARLAQGRHHELVPALRAADPLRERSWGQLMVALYRSGRQADALAAYRDAHRALAEVGLEPGPQLRAVERMVLLQDAALEFPTAVEHRLPRYRTSFVGRDAVLASVEGDIRGRPLVTIVGPAGVGKTRLAVEVAARAGRRPRWVDLAATGAGRVGAAVASALAIPQVPGRAPADLVAARLGEAPSLLLLDNCEHVADEAARLAERLLERDARVRILATSREPLRVAGEKLHRLEGLASPHAVRLFLDRAGAGVAGTDAVSELVERLDGLPLAIELAAGKLPWVSAAELARDLRERLSLLGDGPRTAPARQRTLDAAIAWSYELLSDVERRVLRRLSVFPASFDAPAAAAVAAVSAVLPALTRLADASLLVVEPHDDGTRYRLLMTVRAFARERLTEAGEATAAARRHREAYLALAEELDGNMVGAGLATWLPRGRREHENFQAALHWSLDRGDAEPAFQLAARLGMYWFRAGFVKDGRDLLERTMLDADPAGRLWPRGLVGRTMLANAAGAPDAFETAVEAVAACEAAGDADLLVYALAWRAHALIVAGRLADARVALARARALAESTGSDEGVAFSDQLLGDLLHTAGDLDGAGDMLVRARDRFRRFRAPLDAGFTLVDLARVRLAQGRAHEALEVAREALADFRRREDPRGLAAAFACLGRAYDMLGEPERAGPLLDESMALSRRWGFTLPESRQVDEAGQEVPLGSRVEPLAVAGPGAVRRSVVEERDLDVGAAEELR
jgi:predicted ATPase/DNA-binding SARP family transcriptional activator